MSPHKNNDVGGPLLIKPVPDLFVNSLEILEMIVNKENDNLDDKDDDGEADLES